MLNYIFVLIFQNVLDVDEHLEVIYVGVLELCCRLENQSEKLQYII